MIKSTCPHLFLLAIASILLLLLFTIGNCNNYDDQMETTLFEKRLTTDQLNNLLEQENINNENIGIFIRDQLKPYSNRRSSFHAMRGKRRAILP
jgi:hypothetical protein